MIDRLRGYSLGVYIAIGINLLLFGEYLFDQNNAKGVVLVYWAQSILLGIQNVFLMLFARTGLPFEQNGQLVRSNVLTNIFMAGFFTFHYGIFVLAFGAVSVMSDAIPGELFRGKWIFPTLIVLTIGAVLELPQKIKSVRETNTSLFKLMFIPYVRLIPMALVLFGSVTMMSFWIFPAFLCLKLIVDLVYFYTMDIHRPMAGD